MNATRVIRIRPFLPGMFLVVWTDTINAPRCHETLFRRIGEVWTSGEAHPTGCYSSPLWPAPAVIAEALNQFQPVPEQSPWANK